MEEDSGRPPETTPMTQAGRTCRLTPHDDERPLTSPGHTPDNGRGFGAHTNRPPCSLTIAVICKRVGRVAYLGVLGRLLGRRPRGVEISVLIWCKHGSYLWDALRGPIAFSDASVSAVLDVVTRAQTRRICGFDVDPSSWKVRVKGAPVGANFNPHVFECRICRGSAIVG